MRGKVGKGEWIRMSHLPLQLPHSAMLDRKNTAPTWGIMVTGMMLYAALTDGEMVEIGRQFVRSENILSGSKSLLSLCPNVILS